MKSFSHFTLLLLAGIIIPLLLNSCADKEAEKYGYPVETAKMVSHVTSGYISSTGEIKVRFVAPVIENNLVGSTLKKEVFSFDPSIDGITKWEDTQLLVFKPVNPLALRQKYSATLDMARLFPIHEKKLEPLKFDFEIAGREISSILMDLKLKDENNPRQLYYQGKITFTEQINFEDVQKATQLKKGRKKIQLTWLPGEDKKQFIFNSEMFERGDTPQKFVLTIDRKPLEISEEYTKEYSVPALQDLQIFSVIKEKSDKLSTLKIEFSDKLDPDQEIAGLIRIEPVIELTLKKIGKTVHATGDFQLSQDYTLIISQTVRSYLGTTLKKEHRETIKFEDIKPQIQFSGGGVFLPSANEQNVRFLTINLSRVRLEVMRVFESNLGQFLQTERLNSASDRRDDFSNYYVNRVGIQVFNDTLKIGGVKNEWLQHELDLRKLIKPNEKGLFLLSLSFKPEDILYGTKEELEEYRAGHQRYYGDDYYNNPYSHGYFYSHGRVYKPVILSDIGLTYKQAHHNHVIYATDINSSYPLGGVNVTLRTYQNQIISKKITDSEGKAEFQNISQDVFYIEGERNGQRSVIKLNEMAWNLSTFDVGGETVVPGGTRAFIYTERGVYRPGDEINITVIGRNENNTFPDNHPVTLKIYNPKNQLVSEQTKREGIDGFYSFQFQSKPEDLTGNWRAEIELGSRKFYHTLKIETVVPYRLKVNIEPEKERLTAKDEKLKLTLSSTYLFGNPAANLDAEVTAKLLERSKNYSQYKDFSFFNQTIDYQPITKTLFKGKLNLQGNAFIDWVLPSLEKIPSAITAVISAKVFEKGGRPNENGTSIQIDPYPFYVGIKKPEFDYGYARIGEKLQFSAILVDSEGQPAIGKPITYRIYRNRTYWWWEYEHYRDYQLRYKSDVSTELLEEGDIISTATPIDFSFTPDEPGQYLVEVEHSDKGGHTSAVFIRASYWGGGAGEKDADMLTLKTDKEKYYPGDKATISFPVPEEGNILFTLEKGSQIIRSNWYNAHNDKKVMDIEISITNDLVPTVYASISIIQPHQQTLNDRPIRMYGVVPLNVENPETRQELQIIMPDELKSNEAFKVGVQTSDRQPTQFTIAVVDEGLLALTRFQTPDPWNAFFQKLRLGVRSFDLFSQVIGANQGDIFKTFSIGGGLEAADQYRESQLEPKKAKRFKPVSMFKGPLMTDSKGYASVDFEMPDYTGAVRIMVVSAKQNSYGHIDKTVPVKTDLMVMPTLPRVIGPEDKIVVPVTVFAMKDAIGDVTVTLELEGPLTSSGEKNSQMVTFPKAGEEDVQFEIRAQAAVGIGKIKISAKSKEYNTVYQTEIDIRASSPRIYDSEIVELEPDEKVELVIPGEGLKGSNNARISIRRLPNLDFLHRMYWLVRFPYGCIEQTVSAAFPQLYLKTLFKESKQDKETGRRIDRNINAAIRKLRRFQLPDGGFAYWPGNSDHSKWGTNYAGHFLTEAKKLGYSVPQDMFAKWIRYEKSQALITRDNLMVRVYRVYLLALAGQPEIGAMNLLKENNLGDMTHVERWLLAGSYKLAGVEHVANEILKNTGLEVKEYFEFANTYGSTLRDKGIILDMLILFERWTDANNISTELADALSTDHWYSTQTLGYMLLAMGKYIKALEGLAESPPLMSGYFKLPSGEQIDFETLEISYSLEIKEGFGKPIEIYLDKKSNLQKAFVTLDWDGLPLKSNVEDESQNLNLKVEWLDEDGMTIDPGSIVQGKTFWGHFRVEKVPSVYSQTFEEVALVQVLPAGWEIENIRLSGETRPNWMSHWHLNKEEYLDIRDDRIMWFFDLRSRVGTSDFVVKLNAVTVGEFTLPPTIVEAMYNTRYKATKAGKDVTVTAR